MEPHVVLVERYLGHREARGELTASSSAVVRSVLRQWGRWAGQDPGAWRAPMVWGFVTDPAVRPNTAKSRLTKLRPYLRWLARAGVVAEDLTADAPKVPVPRGDPRDLTDDEVRRVLATAPDDRGRLLVVLMVQLGLRAGDVARMRVDDVDERRRRVNVRAKGGRGEPTHWVPITAEAWAYLGPWLDARGWRAGPVVVSYHDDRRPLTPHTVGQYVTRWMAAAGVKRRPHDGVSSHSLRHTTAQGMIDLGADLRAVQHALGHRSIRSTEGYVRREPPGLRSAMEGRRYAA